MPDLNFQVVDAGPLPYAASPHLALRLRIDDAEQPPAPISSVALRCQVRIEPARRRYTPGEQARLVDLFGTPERWGQTLRGMLWTHVNLVVPGFTGGTVVELPLPCSFDFTLAATRYFDALESGDIPLCLLFSGTVYYATDDDGFQVAPISWEKEASYRLGAERWRALMDAYYPNSAWLCVRKDIFDRLVQFRSQRGLPTWEQVLEQLLTQCEEATTP
jgi:hypothetical protein